MSGPKRLKLYAIPAVLSGAGANGWCTALTYVLIAAVASFLTAITYSLSATPDVTKNFDSLYTSLEKEVARYEEKTKGLVFSLSEKSDDGKRFKIAIQYKTTSKTGEAKVSTIGEYHFRHENDSTEEGAFKAEVIGAILKVPSPDTNPKFEFVSREEMVFFRRKAPFGFAPALWTNTYELGFPASVHVFDKAIVFNFQYVNDTSESFSDIYTSEKAAEVAIANSLSNAIRETNALKDIPVELNLHRRLNGGIQWCTVLLFYMFVVHALARLTVYRVLDSRLMADPELSFLREEHDRFDDPVAAKCETIAKNAATSVEESAGVSWRGRGWHCSSAYLGMFATAVAAFRVSGDYKAVPEFLDSASTRILDERTARHALMKYLLWAIPTVGFVGTVVGIGDALLETTNVDSLDLIEKAIAKSTVSSNIGVAFDTTLVALLLSLIGMLIYNFVVQQEELIVTEAGNVVQQQLIRSGEVIDVDEAERRLVEANRTLQDELIKFGKATENINTLNTNVSTTNTLLASQGKSGKGLLLALFLLLVAVLASIWLQHFWPF